jgi:hypothetical protein
MRRALTLLIGAGVACGLAGAASSTSHDGWTQLHRPIHIPHIAPGSPCPASPPDTSFDFRSYGVGQGYGPGPAYPVFGRNPEPDHAGLEFDYPGASLYGAGWSGQKVLWFLRPGYGDRVLVRGRQLDGPYRVRFGLTGPFLPPDELRISGAGGHASTTRLRTGGCYGYQIDGPSYSRVIAFDAKLMCLAKPVHGAEVHAGPFSGFIAPQYDVVDGRFRLHVGAYRDRATGLSQKIPWYLPHSYRVGAFLFVHGQRLAPPGEAFTQRLAEAGSPDPAQHVFPSIIRPPSAGCWRLSFRTRYVRGYLVVRVDGPRTGSGRSASGQAL